MRKKVIQTLAVAAVTFGLLLSTPALVNAALAVFDSAAVAKLADQVKTLGQQLNELTKQTQFLTDITKTVQDQLDAIGALGRITLPFINLGKVANKIRRDVQCLIPDFSGLFPGIDLKEFEWDSICEGRNFYQKNLWFDPASVFAEEGDPLNGSPGAFDPVAESDRWEKVDEGRKVIEARRQAVVKETAANGMAAGDKAATTGAKDAEQAASDLEAAAKAAETQQARLAVIAQGTVLTNKQLVQQNQLLAQLLKTQSTMLMVMSTPVDQRPKEAEKPAPGQSPSAPGQSPTPAPSTPGSSDGVSDDSEFSP